MFWDCITPVVTPRLTAAVERAYAVFAAEQFRGPLICCTCPSCMTLEQAHELVSTPLRHIPSGLMAEYVGSAHEDTAESRAQFRHFLPRILDLVAQCNPPTTTSLEV